MTATMKKNAACAILRTVRPRWPALRAVIVSVWTAGQCSWQRRSTKAVRRRGACAPSASYALPQATGLSSVWAPTQSRSHRLLRTTRRRRWHWHYRATMRFERQPLLATGDVLWRCSLSCRRRQRGVRIHAAASERSIGRDKRRRDRCRASSPVNAVGRLKRNLFFLFSLFIFYFFF